MSFLLGALAALAALTPVALVAIPRVLRMRESERRYRTLLAVSPDLAISMHDSDLRVVLHEGRALAEGGWQPEDLVGRRLADAIPAPRFAELSPHLEAALAGESGTLEWAGVRGGRTYDFRVVPFRAGLQRRREAMLTIRDVTEQRRLQREVEQQGGFLNGVFAQLAGRISVCDADGRLLDLITGQPLAGVHPLEWSAHFGLLHPDGSPLGPHEAPLLRALRGEQVRDVELRVDATTLLVNGGPVTSPDGRSLGAVVSTADLTAFRDTEDRLRRSEERHRRVVESMTDCVFETDRNGCWTHLNDAWTIATGYPVEATLGRPAWEFVHRDDRTAQARALAPLLRGEQVAVRLTHRFLTVEGSERWADVQAGATSGWDGLPTGFVGVMRDITDEQRARQHVAAERSLVHLLADSESLEDSALVLVEALGQDLGWDAAELWQMGDDEHLHRTATWVGPEGGLDTFLDAGETLACEVGEGVAGRAWMSREPVWLELREAENVLRVKHALADGLRTLVALPLRAGAGPVGVVLLASRAPRQPEPGLTRLLETIGAHLGQSLQRQDAERSAARRAADLTTMAAVAHELASQTDLYAARTTLCRAVRDVSGAPCVVLWEPAAGGVTLEVTAVVGAAVHGLVLPLGERSMTGSAFLTGELAFSSDIAEDPRVGLSWHTVTGMVSGAWIPVLQDGRCVGVLGVGWSERRPELTARDQELLRMLAAEAAITLHRIELLGRLQSTARTDALTGLPNRRVWDEDLEREIGRARRHGGSLCLAMVDLDRFKVYNDTHGHQAGDELLAAAATAWRPALRTTDTLARYGGEEFAALLPHSDLDGALIVVERLLATVPFGQTASAGVAVWDGEETAAELLARADAALYEAKDAGRARALVAA